MYALFFGSFLALSNYGYNQTTNHQPLDFYDNMDGMSQGTVNCIVQDKYGYMWFGTQDGLNKFDGIDFTIFKHDNSNPKSLNDNYITAIIEDRNNDLWIGTRNGGLNKYDLETETFKAYLHDIKNPNSLSHNRVKSIVETDDGIIWVATYGGGLNRFNPVTGEFKNYVQIQDDTTSLSSNEINFLTVASSGNHLWVGTADRLNLFDIKSETFTQYLEQKNINSISNNEILSLWEDESHLWIGTNGGLNFFNKTTGNFGVYQHDPNNNTSLSNNIVITILPAKENKIWVGTDGGYLNLFDPASGEFLLQKVDFPRLKTLYRDTTGDLWVGMRGGLNLISFYNTMFKQYIADENGIPVAPNGDIHALCVDENNFIWSGSSVDGLAKINRSTFEITRFTNSDKPNSISDNNIRFLFIDSENKLWVGTGNGLNRYNSKTNSFNSYLPNKKNETSISSGRINYLYEDSKNNFWVCTENGLNKMDRATGEFSVIKNDPNNKNSLFSNNITKFLEDEDGVYWIGLLSNGIDRYDPVKNEFTHYSHNFGEDNSLSNDRISHMYDDGNGNLWVATYGGGLDKFDKATKTFSNYSEKHGLANSSLYCVLPDKNGNLWMSHNEGISMFDTKKSSFKNYFDGIEFNGRAFYQSKEGEILLGSIYSVVTFFPENAIDNKLIPPVHINEFKLFNEVVTPYDNKDILNHVTEETDSIILNHDQNFFSLGFVSLNFVNSENNQMKYMLENFDLDWNEAGKYHHANYTNVPPGKYIFKVIGSNNDLVWNEEGDRIYITILPPWWDTLIFKSSATIFAMALLVFFYKLRTRNIKKQKEDLEKLVNIRTKEVRARETEIINQQESITKQNTELRALNEEKNKLIHIVSHDLRSPLNQIKGLASIIKALNPKLNKETEESLLLINDLIDRQKHMISKILDTNAIDLNTLNLQLGSISVHEVIKGIRSTLIVIAEKKGIEINLNFYNEDLWIEADKNYLIQVLENILSNAIKFSPLNKEIIITTKLEDSHVIISILDEGPGISPEDMSLLFEPFKKLSAQPTDNEDSSGLGLSIAKKYVEQMDGEIRCDSTEGKGANFILSFPQKNL